MGSMLDGLAFLLMPVVLALAFVRKPWAGVALVVIFLLAALGFLARAVGGLQ